MYDRPETVAANDALWRNTRQNLRLGPESLTRDGEVWSHWQSENLLMSQTCGFPYRAKLHGNVQLIATPEYDIECPRGLYFSAFVVRHDDPREQLIDYAQSRFAYNEALSQSGWAAPQTYAAERGFQFTNTVKSGTHINSAEMVAEGRADIASLDAVSWKLMQRWDPWADQLRVIETTNPTPGLPFITSMSQDADRIFEALQAGIGALDPNDRRNLCLKGLTLIAPEDYLTVPTPASP